MLLLSFTALLPTLCLATYVVPLASGSYGVSIQDILLTDHDRPDPYLNLSYRLVPVSVISSTGPSSSCEPILQPYMPNATAKFWEEAFGETYKLPLNHTFTETELILCKPTQPQTRGSPVVLFAPGAGISRYLYNILGTYITAQTGYTVITFDVPGQTEIETFPDGSIQHEFNATISRSDTNDEAIGNVVDNAIIILDAILRTSNTNGGAKQNITASPPLPASLELNTTQVSIIGHSQGGAASIAALLADHRFLAGANIDGGLNDTATGYFAWVNAKSNGSTPNNDTTTRPFLILEHQGNNQTTAQGWTVIWDDVLQGSKWQFQVNNTQHASYGDFGYVFDLYGIREKTNISQKAVDSVIGSITGATQMEVVRGLFAEFLAYGFGQSTAEEVTGVASRYGAFGLEVVNKTVGANPV